MSDRLRVLVYNSTPLGVCDVYRTWMFQPHLEALGIELRSWQARTPPRPPRPGRRLAWADREALEWADVVVFRRAEQTHHLCFDCAFATPSREEAVAHARDRRHAVQAAANEFLRPLWAALQADSRLLAGRGLVYETDDDLLRIPTWNGNRRILACERDLIEAMLRRADLVTVSTPVLAERVRVHSPRVRVIRNAVEPAWYAEATPDPDLPGEPRVLHYGNVSRLVYYDVCRAAVEAVKDRHPDLWRVWLGAPDSPDHRARIAAVVDEVRDYVIGVPDFARALVRARPEIGLAPLIGDEFDRAKSELHWLEYALAGAVTVATRTMAGGPYSVIRNGVDGFLVKSKAEWYDTLLRLARSPGLRAEVAGRARERALAEYDAARRAAEWADAFRWAAEHAGIGRLERHLVVDASAVEAVRRRATASLSHRRRVRRWEEAAARRLQRVRASAGPPGTRGTLVSVVLPLVGGSAAETEPSRSLLVDATLAAVIGGLHRDVEVLLVGPPTAVPATTDERVRRIVLPAATGWVSPREGALDAPPVGIAAEGASGLAAVWARAANRGLAAARGGWVATMEPGVVPAPEHLALLLEVALDGGLEAVYGWLVEPDGARAGGWPPDPEDIPAGCELVSAALSLVHFDPAAGLLGRSPVAERWRRLLALGARVANVEAVVARRLADGSGHAARSPVGLGFAAPAPRPTPSRSVDHPHAAGRIR